MLQCSTAALDIFSLFWNVNFHIQKFQFMGKFHCFLFFSCHATDFYNIFRDRRFVSVEQPFRTYIYPALCVYIANLIGWEIKKHSNNDMIKFSRHIYTHIIRTYRLYRQYKDDDVHAIIRKLEDTKLFHLKMS
jgi:hypothetical protein